MKKQTLREFGLILLNLPAFYLALYLWLILSLLLADKLKMTVSLALIPMGIVFAILLVKLAACTICSPKRWLQSLPVQFLIILTVAIARSDLFDGAFTLGAVVEILHYTLLYTATTFFLQSFELIRDWLRSRMNKKR